MALEYQKLQAALKKYLAEYQDANSGEPYGAWKALERKTGVHSSNLPMTVFQINHSQKRERIGVGTSSP